MTIIVCTSENHWVFDFDSSRQRTFYCGLGVIKGRDVSVSIRTRYTEMHLDCKVLLDPVAYIAYITSAKGARYTKTTGQVHDEHKNVGVNMTTLRAASKKDHYTHLEWNSLQMILCVLRGIHGPRWKLVVCDPECEAHREAIIQPIYEKEMDKADRALRMALEICGKDMVEDVISVIKRMVLEELVNDKFAEVPVPLSIPDVSAIIEETFSRIRAKST